MSLSINQAYKDQPYVFKNGANSGFHEAIGDTIGLSVMSIEHLKKMNIIENYTMSEGLFSDTLMHF